jgi:nitrite reductase/ring-hydroxylating ferredoxin subunit
VDRATATALNRRLLHHVKGGSTDLAATEMAVPATVFTCPDVAAAEYRRLFRETPQPVAFSAEFAAPGSCLFLQVLDMPIALTRDEHGIPHAFVNACAHRGAQVTPGAGGRLVCPFHGWAYDLAGRLLARPGEHCFDTPREACTLAPLPLLERCGLVVIGIDPALPPERLDGALAELEPELACLALDTYRPVARRCWDVRANWKLVNDLSLESYHFRALHRDSVAQVLAPNAVVDNWRRCSRWAFPLKSITRLADLDESAWPDRIEGSCTYTLYPGVMLIVNDTGAQMIRAEPGDAADRSRVSYSGVSTPGCDPEAALQAYEFGGEVFATEDLPMAEACQRGLAAGGQSLRLGRNEPLVQFWHRLWEEALK